jgi:hypothetical protein
LKLLCQLKSRVLTKSGAEIGQPLSISEFTGHMDEGSSFWILTTWGCISGPLKIVLNLGSSNFGYSMVI